MKIKYTKASQKRNRGFGLIEILVTISVLTVGILGVNSLHSVITRQSLDNKARAEALSIAQSRIEAMRNYTNSAATLVEFNTLYADTNGYANSASITGVNAIFTRTENITTSAEVKDIEVKVDWTDPENDLQTISLNTDISFISPRRVGDTALTSTDELVNSPAGRARLGEGALPENAVTTSNADGTSLYVDGDDDLMLVSDNQVVLTLALACQTDDGSCIDFVKIKGRIWIDRANQNIAPGNIFIVASDSAFCARYFTIDGTATPVTSNTTSTVTTANGDYEYFDYTCYIGGGWHGNVGVLLAGGIGNDDKFCVGDPLSNITSEQTEFAARRVYRGMLYQYDANEEDDKQKIAGSNLVRYYSQGIADSTELPVPGSGDASHDFVVTSLQQNITDGAACVSEGIMVRTDSNVNGELGDLFEGVPSDFVCLNTGYLDNYDTTVFGHNTEGCPYDPSDPPAERHIISGVISVLSENNNDNDLVVEAIGLVTSDGASNCTLTPFYHNGSRYFAFYFCDVFDWGNGWNGYVEMVYVGMECNIDSIDFTNVTSSTSGNNFYTCSIGEANLDPELTYLFFSGILDAPNNRELSSATISDAGGSCDLSTDALSYTCVTDSFIGNWTGSLTFTADAEICTATATGSSPATFDFVNEPSGAIALDLVLKSNESQCP